MLICLHRHGVMALMIVYEGLGLLNSRDAYCRYLVLMIPPGLDILHGSRNGS